MNFLCQKVNKKSRRGEKKTTTGPDIKLSEGFSHFLTALFLFAPCAPPSLAAADTPLQLQFRLLHNDETYEEIHALGIKF